MLDSYLLRCLRSRQLPRVPNPLRGIPGRRSSLACPLWARTPRHHRPSHSKPGMHPAMASWWCGILHRNTTDRDGNTIKSTTFDTCFDLRKKSAFLKELRKPWLEWYQAVRDVNRRNKSAHERAVQKKELSAEIKYAAANHVDTPSEIERYAKILQKLRRKYSSRATDIPELNDLLQLIPEYVRLGENPGFTLDFFVLWGSDALRGW